MSIKDSVRNLDDVSPSPPQKTFTVGLPGNENSWVKRRFMMAASDEAARAIHDDAMWSIPDLGGEEW